VQLLHVTHPSGFDHDTGLYHPERPARLKAAAEGLRQSGVAVEEVTAIPLEPADLAIVHDPVYIEAVRRFCEAGGGDLDPDTHASPGSWAAAVAAAGAGPTAVERLTAGFGGPAIVTVRPPGHHALRNRAMGFCLFNNVAITAARLRDAGQRVAIVDWDVHHGNGTQEAFYRDPDVLYVSVHQSPFYPFEGMASEVGEGDGAGTVLNVPLPAFTAGDVYRRAYEELVIPALTAFRPDWILVSCGFDAHAQDPLAELRLVEADYAFLAAALPKIVPADRIVVFLEGGYHLPAIRDSMAAVARALVGEVSLSDPSPYQSPPDAHRVVERVASVVRGRVVGLG
jgi:acetoin utilization deacetylase AcuC-like enzyme